MLPTYDVLYKTLENAGQATNLNIMENEASSPLNNFVQKRRTAVQLVKTHIHRLNAVERAIRAFENHFVAGLALLAKTFPIYLWYRIVKQL